MTPSTFSMGSPMEYTKNYLVDLQPGHPILKVIGHSWVDTLMEDEARTFRTFRVQSTPLGLRTVWTGR